MFYTEPRLSLNIIQHLDRHHKHYEYAKSIVSQYKEGHVLEGQVAYLTDNSNRDIIAYMVYNIISRDYAHHLFKQEGVDLILPPQYQRLFYLDTLDVSAPFQRRGIGEDFFIYATNFNLPILLQSTEDSEMYWYDHGFKLMDYSWMIRG